MKKLLTVLIAVAITMSCTACGNSEELEALREENEELRQQSTMIDPTEKPVENTSKIELIEQLKEINTKAPEYIDAYFTVKNNTGNDINTLTLNIKELDENGNIISTTHPQEGIVISDGQNVTISAVVKSDTYALQLDSYSYYEGSELNNYISGRFDKNIEKLILK